LISILCLSVIFANFVQNWWPYGNVPKGIKKKSGSRKSTQIYLLFGEKIVKISPVDHEIIWLKLKKEINACKIYNPVGNLAEWTKR